MKYVFDIHGVLDSNKEIKKLVRKLRKQGHRIIALTGSREVRAKNELLACEMYRYVDEIWSVSDYRRAQDPKQVRLDNDGNPWIEDKKWWDSCKAEMCDKLNADYMFDDTKEYGNYFKGRTKFVFVDDKFNSTHY